MDTLKKLCCVYNLFLKFFLCKNPHNCFSNKKFSRGFTLAEIIIVVAIVGMLAVLALPRMLRMRLNANEAVAMGTLKTIVSACENYRENDKEQRFPPNLAALTGADPFYLDPTIETAVTGIPKNGYNFIYTVLAKTRFVCSASPANYEVTGVRTFCINESGVLRAADNGGIPVTTEADYFDMEGCQ